MALPLAEVIIGSDWMAYPRTAGNPIQPEFQPSHCLLNRSIEIARPGAVPPSFWAAGDCRVRTRACREKTRAGRQQATGLRRWRALGRGRRAVVLGKTQSAERARNGNGGAFPCLPCYVRPGGWSCSARLGCRRCHRRTGWPIDHSRYGRSKVSRNNVCDFRGTRRALRRGRQDTASCSPSSTHPRTTDSSKGLRQACRVLFWMTTSPADSSLEAASSSSSTTRPDRTNT